MLLTYTDFDVSIAHPYSVGTRGPSSRNSREDHTVLPPVAGTQRHCQTRCVAAPGGATLAAGDTQHRCLGALVLTETVFI